MSEYRIHSFANVHKFLAGSDGKLRGLKSGHRPIIGRCGLSGHHSVSFQKLQCGFQLNSLRYIRTDICRTNFTVCSFGPIMIAITYNYHNSGHYPSHCLLFKTKLNLTLSVCPYLTGNTLRLRHEPNSLMPSIAL
jgi:hypothetical protein